MPLRSRARARTSRTLGPIRATLGGALLIAAALATACGGGGGGGSPLGGVTIVPDMLVCRSRVDKRLGFTEMALRTAQNLGTARIADRNGIERRARIHPDGNLVVFARERTLDDPQSRELFVATIDGSEPEQRLTVNTGLDDEPCWSPTGDAILFTSDRGGTPALWLMDPDGKNPREFLTPLTGASHGAADWHGPSDRVVYSRRDASGVHTLWLVNGDGTGQTQLTTAPLITAAGEGDREPAFAPDGESVVFVRRGGGRHNLRLVDLPTLVETLRFETAGELRLPRFSPTAERIYCGLAEPELGRSGARLAFFAPGVLAPILVWPDERYDLEGLDFLPTMPVWERGDAPMTLPLDEAEIEIAWGSFGFGALSQLEFEDGSAYALRTRRTANSEVAGVTCTYALPIDDGLDVLGYRIRASARVSRTGGESALRISLYNPVDGRFDTAVEVEPATTTEFETLLFEAASLRHVSRERTIRFNVIAEIERGDPAELYLDFVEVVVTTRPKPL
ncbi:MAG: hypothetical protein NXI31_09705 [bacterium]|nr:hypothetical protein [bacterium]